jgi:hypothetical protein
VAGRTLKNQGQEENFAFIINELNLSLGAEWQLPSGKGREAYMIASAFQWAQMECD